MRTLLLIVAAYVVISLSNCQSPLVFTEPQPAGQEAQRAFEYFYQGSYFCTSDSSQVTVDRTCISKEKIFTFVTTFDEIDSMKNVRFEGDQIFVDDWPMPLEVLFMDDQVLAGNLIQRDTFFCIGENQVLKYFRGHQVLNYRQADGNWEVWLLSQDYSGNISLLKTILPENLEELEAITPVTDISTRDFPRFRLSPTKTEFRELMNSKLIFEECDYYERIDVF